MTNLRTAAQAIIDAVHSEHCLLEYRDHALIAALENALKSEGIAPPDGWVLVPSEPTADMIEAAIKNGAEGDENIILYITSDYKAMLAAAPKPEVKP